MPREYPYLVALWVTAAEVVDDAALGLVVIADHTLIAGGYYHALTRPWGPSLASDQVIGGGALWVLGDIIGLPFLAAVLIAMIREDESDARAIDAELDAGEAAGAATGAVASLAEAATPEAGQRLWWHDDAIRRQVRAARSRLWPGGQLRPARRAAEAGQAGS